MVHLKYSLLLLGQMRYLAFELASFKVSFGKSISFCRLICEIGTAFGTRGELVEAGLAQEVVLAHFASEGFGRRRSGANDAVQNGKLK